MVSNDRWKIARRAGSGALGAAGLAFVAKDLRLWKVVSYSGSRVALVLILVADGTLSGEALNRLTHGLELLKQGLAPRLVVGELRPPRAHYADAARALMGHL